MSYLIACQPFQNSLDTIVLSECKTCQSFKEKTNSFKSQKEENGLWTLTFKPSNQSVILFSSTEYYIQHQLFKPTLLMYNNKNSEKKRIFIYIVII